MIMTRAKTWDSRSVGTVALDRSWLELHQRLRDLLSCICYNQLTIRACRARSTSVGGAEYETSTPVFLSPARRTMSTQALLCPLCYVIKPLSSLTTLSPRARSDVFPRLLCLVTCPKYFSLRDSTGPSKALSRPTLRRTSSFVTCTTRACIFCNTASQTHPWL